MKINKYLKELGLTEYDLPGNYYPDLELEEGAAAADIRNKEDEEGFCSYEFFSLDYTLSLYIYSKLCYFREHIADLATPGCLCTYKDSVFETEEEKNKAYQEAHQLWLSIIDKMVEAFKLKITGVRDGYEGIDNEKIRKGMQCFIDYYDCLWY